MAREKREVGSLLTAAALHGALIFAISLWAGRHPPALASLPVSQPAPTRADEFDVDWTDRTESASAASIASSLELPQRSARPASLAKREEPAGALPKATSLDAPGQPAPAPLGNLAAAAPLPLTSAPLSRPVDLGLGSDGWQRWLPVTQADARPPSRDSPRPLFRMPQPSPNGGLREGLEARDRAVSLGSSGPVVHALFDAAHGDAAPLVGLARFQVTVLKSGAVEVSVHDASRDVGGWRAVADEAASRLRKALPRIPQDREGVHLLVEIRAEYTLPNGLKQKDLSGPHVEVSRPRFRSTADAQKKLKDLNPVAGENGALAAGSPAITDLPGVYIAQRGKVCGYRVGLSALGPVLQGGCDLSNLGAKPQRMVHTRVAEETAF